MLGHTARSKEGAERREAGPEPGSAGREGSPVMEARCARQDSNLRPLPPQGSALSPELRARGGSQSSGLRLEDDLAESLAGFDRAMGLGSLCERQFAVDHRLQVAL